MRVRGIKHAMRDLWGDGALKPHTLRGGSMRNENNKSRVISTDKLHIESKTLFVDLKENEGGRFLQIAELSNARRSTVVIPFSGFPEFMEALQKIADEFEPEEEQVSEFAGGIPEGV